MPEKNSDMGNLIITRYKERLLTALVNEKGLLSASFYPENPSFLSVFPPVGTIIRGKIKKKHNSLKAYFVEIVPGGEGYLPFSECNGDYKIGDEITVMLIKEQVKLKQPVLSMKLNISGKYAAVTNESADFAISSKASKRKSEDIIRYLKNKSSFYPYKTVIRTNSLELSSFEYDKIFEDIEALNRKMDDVLKFAGSRVLFSQLYRPLEGIYREVEETYDYLYDKIYTDDITVYDNLSAYIKDSSGKDKLCFHDSVKSGITLLNRFSLGKMIDEALSSRVWLKSGGFLIFEMTEAFNIIDVNTGKAEKKGESEDYFYSINMEACEEIMKQICIRNLSGIILIDFINMSDKIHNDNLMKKLRELAERDRIHTSVIDMTALGIVEMTRTKKNAPLIQAFNIAGGKTNGQ